MLEGTVGADGVARGAYVLARPPATPDLVLVGTGSEVRVCVEAAERLLAAEGIATQVVSMPSWELFAEQDDGVPGRRCCPPDVPTLAVEAGVVVRLGPLGRRQRRHRPLRRVGPGRAWCSTELGFTPEQRGRAGPAAARATWRTPTMTERTTRLHELYDEQGQSPWLDNLRRGWHHRAASSQRWVERRHPRHHLEPDDLPEGDQRRRRLRRAVRRARSAAARRSTTPTGTLVIDDIARRPRHPAPGLRRERRRRRLRVGRGRARRWPATPTAPIAAARDAARAHRRAQPVREDPRHRRGRARRSSR